MGTAMTFDELRREQAREAVALATEVRQRRAAQRRRFCELGSAEAHRAAVVLINDPPEWCLAWHVYGLLNAVPAVGHYQAYRALRACGIPDNRVVGALDGTQRRALCLWLEERAARLARQQGRSRV